MIFSKILKRCKLWKTIKWLTIVFVLYVLYSGYRVYQVGMQDDGKSADCAIVLGAAAWHKKPSPVFAARLDHAIKLYHSGRVKTLILTGGKGKGAPYAESEVGLTYCVKHQVERSDILIEVVSGTTFENVYEAKKLMEAGGFEDALVVSDPWHLRRATLMAKGAGLDVSASATQTSKYKSFSAKALFFSRELLFVQVYHVFGF